MLKKKKEKKKVREQRAEKSREDFISVAPGEFANCKPAVCYLLASYQKEKKRERRKKKKQLAGE